LKIIDLILKKKRKMERKLGDGLIKVQIATSTLSGACGYRVS